MKFTKTTINGVSIVELEKKADDRGFLARMWGEKEFKEQGIDFSILEGYVTHSPTKGTMRGFHYLTVPEKKLTRVLKGSIYEVVIDVNPESKTFKKWEAFTLKDSDYKMVYMGPGIAHAILTLEDNTELQSLYAPAYAPGNEGGIRYNDPTFKITWPIEVTKVSEKDIAWKDFT